MLVFMDPQYDCTFAITADDAHARRIARVAVADTEVSQVAFVSACCQVYYAVGENESDAAVEVTVGYAVTREGAEELANAWLAASALLPEVTL